MKIGLLGFGTVGAGVLDLVNNQSGMKVISVLRRKITEIPGCSVTNNIDEIISNPEIDTVVEVIGGISPTAEYVIKALKAGKNVVTANKALLAAKYDELIALATENKVKIRASASVGGSIGWLTNLERANRVQEIDHIHGIFNGTCNYMLDLMTREGFAYQDVLAQAQCLGYAEADPSADVDGLDTAAKLTVSANIAFGISLNPDSISVAGIRHITANDIAIFKKHGYVCKLIGTANNSTAKTKNNQTTPKHLEAFVQPTLVPNTAPEAAVYTNHNMTVFRGTATGTQSFLGQGAGRYPTAYNVLQDLCDIQAGKNFHTTIFPTTQSVAQNNTAMKYYLSGSAADLAHWQENDISTNWGEAIITTPQPVAKVHDWLKRHPQIFAAAIQE